jgi:hypothetical protein
VLKLSVQVCAAMLTLLCLVGISFDRAHSGDRLGSPEVIPPDFIAMPSGGCAKPAK